jgi:hypothetical protein
MGAQAARAMPHAMMSLRLERNAGIGSPASGCRERARASFHGENRAPRMFLFVQICYRFIRMGKQLI